LELFFFQGILGHSLFPIRRDWLPGWNFLFLCGEIRAGKCRTENTGDIQEEKEELQRTRLRNNTFVGHEGIFYDGGRQRSG